MTCQDCIHISTKQVGKFDYFPIYACNKTSFYVKGIAPPCKYFTYNDGTYHNGSWHCPRCGVPVSKWGLCMDCEIFYVTPERRTVPVNLKIDNIIKHEFDFSGIEEIEDSWEDESK